MRPSAPQHTNSSCMDITDERGIWVPYVPAGLQDQALFLGRC